MLLSSPTHTYLGDDTYIFQIPLTKTYICQDITHTHIDIYLYSHTCLQTFERSHGHTHALTPLEVMLEVRMHVRFYDLLRDIVPDIRR